MTTDARFFVRQVRRQKQLRKLANMRAAQIDVISSQFKHGSSMARLSRKHSLPLLTIEGLIRMKMLGTGNSK